MLILPVDKPFGPKDLETATPDLLENMIYTGGVRIKIQSLHQGVLNYNSPEMLGLFLKKDTPGTDAYLDGNNLVGYINNN